MDLSHPFLGRREGDGLAPIYAQFDNLHKNPNETLSILPIAFIPKVWYNNNVKRGQRSRAQKPCGIGTCRTVTETDEVSRPF